MKAFIQIALWSDTMWFLTTLVVAPAFRPAMKPSTAAYVHHLVAWSKEIQIFKRQTEHF